MEQLVQWADKELPTISEKAQNTIRMAFVDFYGVCLAALDDPIYVKTVDYVAMTAKGSQPLPGSSARVGAQQAAIAWGTLGHILDYDDISAVMIGHPSAVLIPALAAFASENGKGGKELIDAYHAGYEVIGRMSARAAEQQYQQGWHTTPTIGIFGAVIGSARLLGLNREQANHALGIACSLASGLRANFGTMTKPFHAGWAAGNAVVAVELAARGFDSSPDALESYFSAFGGSSQFPESEHHYIEDGLIIKRFPSCGFSLRAIDCALAIIDKSELPLEQIERINCYISPMTDKVLRYRNPANATEAKFSLEYNVAQALISGPLRLAHYEDEFVNTPSQARSNLMNKINRVIPEDMQNGIAYGTEYIEVEILLTNGNIIRKKVFEPKGYPANPLSSEEFMKKFEDCTIHALNLTNRDMIYEQLIRLDAMKNFSIFMNDLVGSVNEFRTNKVGNHT